MDGSNVEPVVGCTIISPGCTNCYAMRMARRLEAMGQPKYAGTTRMSGGRPKWNSVVRIDEESLTLPETWKTGRMIFVNSMSDLFHEDVPLAFIKRVFTTMRKTPHHTYQILDEAGRTPRRAIAEAGMARERLDGGERRERGLCVQDRSPPARTGGDQVPKPRTLARAARQSRSCRHRLGYRGRRKRASCSGPLSRDWVRSIRDQCFDAEVAFHFKQWGGVSKKKAGRILDGRTWDEFPASADM